MCALTYMYIDIPYWHPFGFLLAEYSQPVTSPTFEPRRRVCFVANLVPFDPLHAVGFTWSL